MRGIPVLISDFVLRTFAQTPPTFVLEIRFRSMRIRCALLGCGFSLRSAPLFAHHHRCRHFRVVGDEELLKLLWGWEEDVAIGTPSTALSTDKVIVLKLIKSSLNPPPVPLARFGLPHR